MKVSLKKLGIVMLIVFLGIAIGQLAFAKDKGFVIGLSQPNMEHPYRVGGTNKAKAWAEAHKDLIAELILDCETSIPINDFCYGRFSKGSDHECACQGNAACTTVTAVCPNKREWLKSI